MYCHSDKVNKFMKNKMCICTLFQANNELEIENTILKKKLADIGKDIATGKENSAPRSNSSQLNMRKKTTPNKVTASPSVLKDHNY